MIQLIQFSERHFCIAAGPRPWWTRGEGQCSIEFDLGKGGTISEFHRGQLVYLIYAIDPERTPKIFDLVLELFSGHMGISRIHLDLFDSTCKRLEIGTTPDVEIEFTCRAVKGAGSEEHVSLSLRKCRFD